MVEEKIPQATKDEIDAEQIVPHPLSFFLKQILGFPSKT
jgi:hypothetical protein